jgi:hypothetical protein
LGKKGQNAIARKEKSKILDYVGVELEDLSSEDKALYNSTSGIRVLKIFPGKIRSNAEMRAGFIITKINKTMVESVAKFIALIEVQEGGVLIGGFYPGDPDTTHWYAVGVNQ